MLFWYTPSLAPNIPTSIMNEGILTALGPTWPRVIPCVTQDVFVLQYCTYHLNQLTKLSENAKGHKFHGPSKFNLTDRRDISNLVLISPDVSSQATSPPYCSRRNSSGLRSPCLWQLGHRSRIVPWEFPSPPHTRFVELQWRTSRARAICRCLQELVGRHLRRSPPVHSPKSLCFQWYKVAWDHPVTEWCGLGSAQTNGIVN